MSRGSWPTSSFGRSSSMRTKCGSRRTAQRRRVIAAMPSSGVTAYAGGFIAPSCTCRRWPSVGCARPCPDARHFIRIQTAEVNATKRLLRGAGWRAGTQASLRSAGSWERLLEALGVAPELQGHIRLHRAVWQQAGEQVRALDHLLGELARDWRDEVHRLEAVPGVGPIVALTAIAVFADVHRFASAKRVASYAGLVPSTYQSGTADRHGHITKRGAAELRTMLCEAAHHARRPAHPLNPYFAKLCARRGYKIAIVAVAHRLCRLLYALPRAGTEFQPARLGVEEGPFTQTITRRFRLSRSGRLARPPLAARGSRRDAWRPSDASSSSCTSTKRQ